MVEKNIASVPDVFNSAIRIQMLASLSVSPMSYANLKKVCQCSDGTMSHNTKKLKEEGYIIDVKFHVSKENRDAARILSGSKIIPRTFYEITDLGLQEYKNFINLILKEYNKQQITEMQEKGERNYEKDLRIAD